MTNTEFAKAIGCHFTTASRYRNGHRLPEGELFIRMQTALGMPHDEFEKVWLKGKRYQDKHGKSRPWGNPFGKMLRQRVFNGQAA